MRTKEGYFKSAMFGFEDALLSTTGTIIGISIGTHDKKFLLLAGLVIILVEAISMATSEFLSNEAVEELDKVFLSRTQLFTSSIIMFFAYFSAGMVPFLPIILLSFPYSTIGSLVFAFLGLFTLGYFKGKYVHTAPIRSATEMLIIGGIATTIGVIVGYLLKI